MSWREPIASEVEVSPLQRLREEIRKPRTYNDLWKQHIDEQIERGVEFDDEGAELFNLNKTAIEME
jgi:hypothetical protein